MCGGVLPVRGTLLPAAGTLLPVAGRLLPTAGMLLPVPGAALPGRGDALPGRSDALPAAARRCQSAARACQAAATGIEGLAKRRALDGTARSCTAVPIIFVCPESTAPGCTDKPPVEQQRKQIWTFARGDERLVLQRQQNGGGEELVVLADGVETSRIPFNDSDALEAFQSDMEEMLVHTGWLLARFDPERRRRERRRGPRVTSDRRRWWTDPVPSQPAPMRTRGRRRS